MQLCDKLVKLSLLEELINELHEELTGEDTTELYETSELQDMVQKAMSKVEKQIAEQKEKEKLDSYVYVIIQKIKNYRKEEIILNIFNECFSTYEQAESYIQGHYRAKRTKKYHIQSGWKFAEEFENDDFIYQIRKVAIVSKYEYDNDRIIYREVGD